MVRFGSLFAKRSDAIQTLATDPLLTVQTKLATSANGLTQNEAQARLSRYGHNELLNKAKNPLLTFLSSIWGLSSWMIEVAAILSVVMKRWTDFVILTVLFVINYIIRFVEVREAGDKSETLSPNWPTKAMVKRDGRWRTSPARDLVPGDIVRLRTGDIVPADVRVLDGKLAQVNQAIITGESLLITLNMGDVVYAGSVIRQGIVDAVVYATGDNTALGTVVHLKKRELARPNG